ncbi:hypothetical protein SUGI_0636610 [Cryptomeria japonica]|nr:hypothetical protein SUGI_0636550 [Cryptomeria japonica]GLJ31680.1 hypothetical protein SUGI_0636610 [Cryptomeria japonica]
MESGRGESGSGGGESPRVFGLANYDGEEYGSDIDGRDLEWRRPRLSACPFWSLSLRGLSSCFKLPAANDVFPEEEGKHDENAKKMKDSSEKKKGSSCSAPIVVSYFPLGSNLSRL